MTTSPRLPRATPESQGIDSAAIVGWVRAAHQQIHDHHSFLIVRHGHVVAEGSWHPYAAASPHVLFSLSKSFTSSAVGMAVAEGLFSLDDAVISLFPDALPAEIGPNLAAMKVRHLLSMTTGHAADTTWDMIADRSGDWARVFLALPVEHAPGTHFLYNTGATYMLSAIVQRRSGQKLIDYLGPRLLEPLGIAGAEWMQDPRGVNTGGWGLSTRVEDIACFGQLYLQNGVWHGRRLLDAAWVAEATRKQTYSGEPNNQQEGDWQQGYGYQFWRSRHNSYRGDGAFGQYCLVLPEQDAVIAITSGLANLQEPLDLIWQHLLPALGAEPLPANPAAQAELAQALAGLAIEPPAGEPSSPLEPRLAGKLFALAPHPSGASSLAFEFAPDHIALVVGKAGAEHRLELGRGAWRMIETSASVALLPSDRAMVDASRFPAAGACAAWSAPDTLVAAVRHQALPIHYTLTCRFAGDRLIAQLEPSVKFGEEGIAPLEGVAENLGAALLPHPRL